jgi:hypothetical protein
LLDQISNQLLAGFRDTRRMVVCVMLELLVELRQRVPQGDVGGFDETLQRLVQLND